MKTLSIQFILALTLLSLHTSNAQSDISVLSFYPAYLIGAYGFEDLSKSQKIILLKSKREKRKERIQFYGLEHSIMGKILFKDKVQKTKIVSSDINPHKQIFASGIKVRWFFAESQFGPGLYNNKNSIENITMEFKPRLTIGLRITFK